jgi:predicted nucleotidyltransferase
MANIETLEAIVAPVTAWARSRPDILGLAVVGSWARGAARAGSDVDLILLASDPQSFRYDENWLIEIHWGERRIASWRDADYGAVWSRHVQLTPPCEIEFTFCAPAWAATDPVDPGTANVVSNGCRVLLDMLDKARLFEKLLAVAGP